MPEITLKAVPENKAVIRLLPYTPEIAGQIIVWAENPRNAEFFRRCPPVCDWLTVDKISALCGGLWLVYEDDKAVGLAGLFNKDPFSRTVEFGMMIDGASNQKLACTAVCNQVGSYCFEYLNMHKVIVRVMPWREFLAKRLELHGFTKEADLRDSCYFKGEYHNEMLYSCLKLEFKEIK